MTDLLGLTAGETVAIVGCGGKSTLLFQLAKQWQHQRILLSTTTKILRPIPGQYHFLYTTPEQWANPDPRPGVHIIGSDLGRKLGSLPLPELERLHKGFDLTLLESDGSRGLPLKGWREDEPVVPDFTDVTVGMAVVYPLGKPVTEDQVFQPQLFCAISGAVMGEPLTLVQLASTITHPQGLFHHAHGRKVLLLNQVEDEAALTTAKALVALMPQDLTVIAGSLHKQQYTILKET